MARKDSIAPVRNAFILDGKLYYKARVIQQENLVYAYDAETGKMVQFVWTVIRSRKQRVWRAKAVATMMGRRTPSIRQPYASGKLDYKWVVWREDIPTLPKQIFWDREEIFKLHDYFREQHKNPDGTFRKARGIPSRIELANMINTGIITYVQNKDGKYIPAFAAPDLKY